jgi:hypothetical protein
MMHGREKSDSAIVAEKPTNKVVPALRSRRSQGRGPRGMRASKARFGHSAENACHRRWSAYGKSAVTHPRWEPCAGILHARIWAGGGQ